MAVRRAMQEPELISSDDLYDTLVELIAKRPKIFKGVTILDFGSFIDERQYLIDAMKAEICSSREDRHVWSFEEFDDAICFSCVGKIEVGLLCLKCLMRVHYNCYRKSGDCRLNYYTYELPSQIRHLYSCKTMTGECKVCGKHFGRQNIGRVCRWCGEGADRPCTEKHNPCDTSRFWGYLYPPTMKVDNAAIKSNYLPVLIFINGNAYDGLGEKLMRQFLMILHPMQVIDIRYTDPNVGFNRFLDVKHFTVFIIGGDRMCTYILKAYGNICRSMVGTPQFRFIPLDPQAEIGRTFGGRIKYSKKSAEYLLEQLSRLETRVVNRWEVQENPRFQRALQFRENFVFSFAFGLETYVERQMERERFWARVVRTVTPARLYNWFVRWQDIRRWGVGPEPTVDEFLTLKVNEQYVDLTQERFLAIILVSRTLRGDEVRSGCEPYSTENKVDVYGITEYFKLTKRNIEKKGIKLAETNLITVCLGKNCSTLTDGQNNSITHIEPGQNRYMNLELNSSLKVLAVSERYLKGDKPLMPKGRREGEDEPLSLAELFLAPLEMIQREKESKNVKKALENRRQEIRHIAEFERREAARKLAEEAWEAEEKKEQEAARKAEEEKEQEAARKAEEEKEQEAARKAAEEEQEAARKAAAEEAQEVETRPTTEEEQEVARKAAAEEAQEVETRPTTEEEQEVARKAAAEGAQEVETRPTTEEEQEAARKAAAEKEQKAARRAAAEKAKKKRRREPVFV